MNELYQGLFIAKYDYGFGNELVPYLREEMTTVWTSALIAMVLIWLVSLIIASQKKEHMRVYISCGYLALASLVTTGLFGYCLWDTNIASVFMICAVITGIVICIVCDALDDIVEEDFEKEEREYRSWQIEEYKKWLLEEGGEEDE